MTFLVFTLLALASHKPEEIIDDLVHENIFQALSLGTPTPLMKASPYSIVACVLSCLSLASARANFANVKGVYIIAVNCIVKNCGTIKGRQSTSEQNIQFGASSSSAATAASTAVAAGSISGVPAGATVVNANGTTVAPNPNDPGVVACSTTSGGNPTSIFTLCGACNGSANLTVYTTTPCPTGYKCTCCSCAQSRQLQSGRGRINAIPPTGTPFNRAAACAAAPAVTGGWFAQSGTATNPTVQPCDDSGSKKGLLGLLGLLGLIPLLLCLLLLCLCFLRRRKRQQAVKFGEVPGPEIPMAAPTIAPAFPAAPLCPGPVCPGPAVPCGMPMAGPPCQSVGMPCPGP